MIDEGADRAALARALQAWVDHLRTGWDVAYVPRHAPPAIAPPVTERTVPAAPVPTERTAPVRETDSRSPSRTDVPVASQPVASQPVASQPAPSPSPSVSERDLRRSAATWSAAQKLEYLRDRSIGDCRRCGLCQSRSNIVFGVGSAEARLMFVGEAPGADEDRLGEPFVGRAGQRLDLWLQSLGLRRADVYIANVLKCRPPGNRDPRPDEVERCAPFLQAQIRAIAPKVLVALGRHAGMLLSRRDDLSLRAMRSTTLHYDASGRDEQSGTRVIPLIVTYHPAYVLRQEREPTERASVNETVLSDLQRALQLASG